MTDPQFHLMLLMYHASFFFFFFLLYLFNYFTLVKKTLTPIERDQDTIYIIHTIRVSTFQHTSVTNII